MKHHKPIFWAPGQVLHKLDDTVLQVDVSDYESFIYKSSSFKVSLLQYAQDSIAWESYVIMYINDINLSTSTFCHLDYILIIM